MKQMMAALEMMSKRVSQAEQDAKEAKEELQQVKARSPAREEGASSSQEHMMRLMVETVKEAMKEVKPAKSLVDNKAIGKPTVFRSKEPEFQQWSMKFLGFVSGIWPQARAVLEWAAESETSLTNEQIKRVWCDDADEIEKIEDIDDMSQQIQSALISLLEGEAGDLVVGATEGGGLESWRKITRRFDPFTVGRSRNMLQAILNPGNFKCLWL